VPEKNQWGLRAGFLEYHAPKTTVTLGLQTMSMGETLLLDERGLGLSAKSEIGPLTLRLAVATVTADFAKMQDFCAVRHAYSIVRGGRLDLLGDALGETNLVGGSLEYAPPSARATQSRRVDGNEDEFEAIESPRPGVIRRVGLVYLQEFGDGFGRYRQFFGATAALRAPGGLDTQLEIVYQDIPTKSAWGYLARVDRDFGWNSGALTRIALGYVGSRAIDEHARFSPAFANLFLGEIMRLDVARAPLAFARVEQTLAVKTRPYARLFYVAQLEDDRTSELDLELGLRVFRGARIFIAQGWIQSDVLPSATRTSRLGLRWAF
jgi:hypothetical protein